MEVLLVRALNFFRPRDGWVAFLLTWAALLSVAAGCQEAQWVSNEESRLFFTIVALAGGVVGLGLAWSRLTGRVAGAVGALGGLAFVVSAVGRVLPPWAQVMVEFDYAGRWLQRGWSGGGWGQLPFQSLMADSGARLGLLFGRLADWWSTVQGGGVSRDNVPFLLLTGLAFWAAAILGMWGVYRMRRPLTGLMPAGALLVFSLYHSDEGLPHLLLFLACGAFLAPWMRFVALTASWEQRKVDYSPEVRFEVTMVGLLLAVVVVMGGVLVPSLSVPQIARWVWERWSGAWQPGGDEGVWRVFGGIRRPQAGGQGVIPVGMGGLPRAHLLSGGGNLSRQPVMAVTTDDPPPSKYGLEIPRVYGEYEVPQYYWRALTFDDYTGHGWKNETLEEDRYVAGESLPILAVGGRRELRQDFVLFTRSDATLYAAGEPITVSVPVRANRRAPDDLAGLEKERVEQQYTVVSLVPDVGESALRQASTDYPAAILDRYLQLSDDVPQRVLDLAQEVIAEAPTAYDKALALQAYLRQFDYSLDLEPPPPDQDVVDYFLFDLQAGYCDYYATTMVVMARAVGLPARLAMGYASGTYDFARRHYNVVEADAHSWPEIYFPGHGWIEFEPTAARRPFEREGARPLGELPPLPSLPPRSPAGGMLPGVRILIGGGALLLAVLILPEVWKRWPRLKRLPGPALMATIYRRLARHGERFGVPMHASNTPGEYGRNLIQAVTRRAEQPRWQGWSLSHRAQSAADRLATLERNYLKATYSSHPLTEDERWEALSVWRGLASQLWLIWLGGKAVDVATEGQGERSLRALDKA
jgi:transglutaminase-like putative cysteine protease